ncbi:MAG TPA: TonB-dependent receptor [Bacteroidia bacterium]|nr:TonB-dependent receptor [Bacteroidia bacterium]HRU68083.1 TonB-dependent receptor [Bacteroidia bacterium]
MKSYISFNLHFFRKDIFFILMMLIPVSGFSQPTAVVKGIVRDLEGKPVEFVNVSIEGSKTGTTTNQSGFYQLQIAANKETVLIFSYIGKVSREKIPPLLAGQVFEKNVVIDVRITLKTFDVEAQTFKESGKTPIQKVDTRALDVLPATSERVIALIKTLPGVSSNSELSSSYSVRGGNYDENLVYINDIEIYRPFLIRSGQQEGLPIINSSLVESIRFSAGGFEAKYGDKLSSVLDITYKNPRSFNADFSASLLGASVHAEGRSENTLFSYLIGGRWRTNRYLLNSLDVKGNYNTSFADYQSYFNWYLSPEWKIGLFSYAGRNFYNLIPENQSTSYGTHQLVLRLDVYFEGQEITSYKSFLNALDLSYNKKDSTFLKFIFSVFNTVETEYYDVLGEYWLRQIETNPASEQFGDPKLNLGVGAFLNHARNRLFADVYSFQIKGRRIFKNNEFQYGTNSQVEIIEDKLREWRLLDSAGYSIPLNPDELTLERFLNTKVQLSSFRQTAYFQNTFTLSDSNRAYLTAGIRSSWWSYNNELIITPRIQFVIEPFHKKNLRIIEGKSADTALKPNFQIKASAGMYYQPPFYRELRSTEGILNPEIRSQKSYQFLLGTDYYFRVFDKTFKWYTEIYYKYLTDIIPYDVDDIRVRYYARNNATGYSAGIDLQLYGELVGNLPSWLSLSVMSTKEDLDDDYTLVYDSISGKYLRTEQGLIPRPTDQRFMASLLFQDFFPKIRTSRVHLNLIYGTPLPFGPPQFPNLRNKYRMRAYRRVDIGFSQLLVSNKENYKSRIRFLNNFDELWVSAEVFNLFGIQNVISYLWVKDVNNNFWGVPSYLTARRLNVSITAKF